MTVCALAMAVSLKAKATPMSWAPFYDDDEYDQDDNFQMICEGMGRLH